MGSAGDLDKIKSQKIDPPRIERQLLNFKNGFPPICLVRAATTGDGILSCSPSEKKSLQGTFGKITPDLRVLKFVPASGAATRMFKPLFEFRQQCLSNPLLRLKNLEHPEFNSVHYFFSHFEKFAFFEDLVEVLKNDGKDVKTLLKHADYTTIIDSLLFDKGLNYASLPKALLLFHRYPDGSRASMEEHLVEAANYASEDKKTANLHFTLSPEHQERFQEKLADVLGKYEKQFNLCFVVHTSVQKPSTDTIAVDLNNIPLRNEDGTFLYRPAGHGALIENLNEIDADIIFIKNIDNVVPDVIKEPTYKYKRVLGGYLLRVREKIVTFLEKAEQQRVSDEEADEMASFAIKQLMICLPLEFKLFNLDNKIKILKQKLNRPIRVCGMVKNEGEPGGGPYWVKDRKGSISLQIVESSQINPDDTKQKMIFDSATHFNPVDIVCCIKDFRGNTFNLPDYVDDTTGFISLKSIGGKDIKALELPGLWNGAMADWITVFIEVPVITFNPVKIINDLLRKEHQS